MGITVELVSRLVRALAMACLSKRSSPSGNLDCKSRHFFVHLPDGMNTVQSGPRRLWFGEDFWCHRCRTMQLGEATAIVFGRSLAGFGNDRSMFMHLNATIATHPRLYVVIEHNWPISGILSVACGGGPGTRHAAANLASCDATYRAGRIPNLPKNNGVIPSQTRYIASEGHFWYRESLDGLRWQREPKIPARAEDACYVAAPGVTTPVVFSVPYQGTLPRQPALVAASRPYRVHYHAGVTHGRAVALRVRLYQLCSDQPLWFCGNASTILDPERYAESLQMSDFCFVPTGDSPSRATLFYAIRNGCVPVFFASCDQNFNLNGYPEFLPRPNSTSRGFGPHGWALLVNQTAVMLDDKHLVQVLTAVTPPILREMRSLGLSYARRTAWTSGQEHERSDAPSATDVLVANLLGLAAPSPPSISG